MVLCLSTQGVFNGVIWVFTLDENFLQFAPANFFKKENHKKLSKFCYQYKNISKHPPQNISGNAPVSKGIRVSQQKSYLLLDVIYKQPQILLLLSNCFIKNHLFGRYEKSAVNLKKFQTFYFLFIGDLIFLIVFLL